MTLIIPSLLIVALAQAKTTWPEPRSAAEYVDELSRIQMLYHRRGLGEALTQNRVRRIPWADVRTRQSLDQRVIVDPKSGAPTARIIDRLGVVNERRGERHLRIFFHPEDTLFRKWIIRGLKARGDRIVGWGSTIGYASASRSIFVPVDDHVVTSAATSKRWRPSA